MVVHHLPVIKYINFIFFAIRYKIIKEKASQSGSGAPRPWIYYTAMDDMMAGDPAICPLVVEQSIPHGVFVKSVLHFNC